MVSEELSELPTSGTTLEQLPSPCSQVKPAFPCHPYDYDDYTHDPELDNYGPSIAFPSPVSTTNLSVGSNIIDSNPHSTLFSDLPVGSHQSKKHMSVMMHHFLKQRRRMFLSKINLAIQTLLAGNQKCTLMFWISPLYCPVQILRALSYQLIVLNKFSCFHFIKLSPVYIGSLSK